MWEAQVFLTKALKAGKINILALNLLYLKMHRQELASATAAVWCTHTFALKKESVLLFLNARTTLICGSMSSCSSYEDDNHPLNNTPRDQRSV